MEENLELIKELESKLEGITQLNEDAIDRIIIVSKAYGVPEDKVRIFLDDLQRKNSIAMPLIAEIAASFVAELALNRKK